VDRQFEFPSRSLLRVRVTSRTGGPLPTSILTKFASKSTLSSSTGCQLSTHRLLSRKQYYVPIDSPLLDFDPLFPSINLSLFPSLSSPSTLNRLYLSLYTFDFVSNPPTCFTTDLNQTFSDVPNSAFPLSSCFHSILSKHTIDPFFGFARLLFRFPSFVFLPGLLPSLFSVVELILPHCAFPTPSFTFSVETQITLTELVIPASAAEARHSIILEGEL